MQLTHICALKRFFFFFHVSTIREISGAAWVLFVTLEICMLHSSNFLVFYSLVACKYRDQNIYIYTHHDE